jgi:hypothetical protein
VDFVDGTDRAQLAVSPVLAHCRGVCTFENPGPDCFDGGVPGGILANRPAVCDCDRDRESTLIECDGEMGRIIIARGVSSERVEVLSAATHSLDIVGLSCCTDSPLFTTVVSESWLPSL